MAELIENRKEQEKVLLVAVREGSEAECEESLDELAELVRTAGGICVGRVVQGRETKHPGTYVGKGKIAEISAMIEMDGVTCVVCDDELTPAQYNNLADELQVKIIDRTTLILDIFAGRARTSEGKIQVELAQLRYRSARLSGFGKALSRQGGGIGTRGPGEKKLEMDRRLIGKRISVLKEELAEVIKHRELIRSKRVSGRGPKVAAIVGYTNAGKSTLLNYLTDAGVLEEDALFATLDPTTRAVDLPDGNQILLTDTVGFIRKLPHHLVDAFRSTLEEVTYADLILHVVDSCSPVMDRQMEVVYDTLGELGAAGKPVYTLFNKIDRFDPDIGNHMTDRRAERIFLISAKTGEGIDDLLRGLSDFLLQSQKLLDAVIPYSGAGLISQIHVDGQMISEEYLAEGIAIKAMVPAALYGKIMKSIL
ncbi:MAG TPA: GTPase HflX [Lachnospiraceae bacterium]|nr:GTPase HflX [Lachnospiraceae bacterium]